MVFDSRAFLSFFLLVLCLIRQRKLMLSVQDQPRVVIHGHHSAVYRCFVSKNRDKWIKVCSLCAAQCFSLKSQGRVKLACDWMECGSVQVLWICLDPGAESPPVCVHVWGPLYSRYVSVCLLHRINMKSKPAAPPWSCIRRSCAGVFSWSERREDFKVSLLRKSQEEKLNVGSEELWSYDGKDELCSINVVFHN